MSTRREFIKQVGIALASMMMARCTNSSGTQLLGITPTPECLPFEASGDSPRECLRSCWRGFAWLTSPNGGNCCQEAQGQLVSAHRAALSALQAAGQLGKDVASEIEAAYGAAVSHTWLLHCRTVCYEPAETLHYSALSRVVQRAAVLDKMYRTGELDPGTVAEVRKALERELTFLDLYPDRVATKREDGSSIKFDELDLEITPEARAAAAFLTELLSGQ